MRSYLIRRILSFIPVLLIISLVSFLILLNSPGDPVDRMMSPGGSGEFIPMSLQLKERNNIRHQLGLDLPVFYFDIHSYRESGVGKYIPAISFHAHNQYHRWLFGDGAYSRGIVRGDFGVSYITRQPVAEIIRSRIGWSLILNMTTLLLAYLICIPLGIKSAANLNMRFDRLSAAALLILYSLPVFWVATLLMMTFANPDVLYILPASGVKPVEGYPPGAGMFQRIMLTIPHLILPVICYLLTSITVLTRLLRNSMVNILQSDYIRTARAKGLRERSVLWKHALKNSVFPVITVFAHAFPAMLGGSVIIETIFTIPGIGSTIYQSISGQDYPVLIAFFTLTGLLTATGFFISDLLYAWVDPRISLLK